MLVGDMGLHSSAICNTTRPSWLVATSLGGSATTTVDRDTTYGCSMACSCLALAIGLNQGMSDEEDGNIYEIYFLPKYFCSGRYAAMNNFVELNVLTVAAILAGFSLPIDFGYRNHDGSQPASSSSNHRS